MNSECFGCGYSICQFCNLVSDREKLLDFLFRHGVLKEKIPCGYCNSELHLQSETLLFTCQKTLDFKSKKKTKERDICGFCRSGREGTFFENISLSIEDISLLVLYFLILNPPRQNLFSQQLSWPQATTDEWINFCSGVCINWFFQRSKKLGGINKVVEISEAEFKNGNCISGIKETYFFVGFERASGDSFLIPVKDMNKSVLLKIVKEWIYVGTKIVSKCWKSYDCLEDKAFHKEATDHLKKFVDPVTETGFCTLGLNNSAMVYTIYRRNYMESLAEFMFKRTYPDSMQRLHSFWLEVAKLYPPS